MTEQMFFEWLEFELCRHFRLYPVLAHRGLWCDGALLRTVTVVADGHLVDGVAWMGGLTGHAVDHQEQWEFTLHLTTTTRQWPPKTDETELRIHDVALNNGASPRLQITVVDLGSG